MKIDRDNMNTCRPRLMFCVYSVGQYTFFILRVCVDVDVYEYVPCYTTKRCRPNF
jgi:hypothetical protein